jgi:hypothetical protein
MSEPILELKKALETDQRWQLIKGYEIKDLDEKTNNDRVNEITQFVYNNDMFNNWQPSKEVLDQCIQNRTWIVNPWNPLELRAHVDMYVGYANNKLFCEVVELTIEKDMKTIFEEEWLLKWTCETDWFHCKKFEDIERLTLEKYHGKEKLITLPLVIFRHTKESYIVGRLLQMVYYGFEPYVFTFESDYDKEDFKKDLKFNKDEWDDGDLLAIVITIMPKKSN